MPRRGVVYLLRPVERGRNMETAEEATRDTEFAKQFEDYLKSWGLRLTQKRLDILDQVFEYPGHFQTEDLLVQMRRNGYRVSRPTIYRTLPLLVRSGLLTAFIHFGNMRISSVCDVTRLLSLKNRKLMLCRNRCVKHTTLNPCASAMRSSVTALSAKQS